MKAWLIVLAAFVAPDRSTGSNGLADEVWIHGSKAGDVVSWFSGNCHPAMDWRSPRLVRRMVPWVGGSMVAPAPRRPCLTLVGLMVLLAVPSLSLDAVAQASDLLRLPLSVIRSSPVTVITVGDRTVQAIVDTGGGGITLSEDVIRSAGGVRLADESVWNDALGREHRVPRFTMPVMIIGGRPFHDVTVAQAAESPEGQGPVVPNMIGQQFLSRYFTIVDYAGLAVTLWDADTEIDASAACGTTRIPMEQTEDPGLVVTEFDTPSGRFLLAWDTGATHSALAETFVASRRLETIARDRTSFYRPARLGAAGQEFGPLEFVVLPLQLPGFQGVLGANFFSDHVVCLDWKKREVRVR